MLIALVVSLLTIGLHLAGLPVIDPARRLLSGIDFNRLLFGGIISYLLFAGSLDVSLEHLTRMRWQVLSLATVGVLGSTVIIGYLLYWILRGLGLELPLVYCLLFGALISPTDPMAVLPIMRKAKAAKDVEILVSGESLFNDGFAVVVFVVLLDLAAGTHSGPVAVEALVLFLREALGGLVFGLVLGWLGYRVLKTIDDYPVEILITLALVSAGYASAQAAGVSGPLAMVVAGIVVGNQGRKRSMSAKTIENLDRFWEMVDIIFNAVLFVLIGLEVLLLVDQFSWARLIAGFVVIPIVLFARLVSVGAPMTVFRPVRPTSGRTIAFVTWAGLRGAIPIALALSLPQGESRDVIVTITYVVVVFSILVQGTTIKYLVRPDHALREGQKRTAPQRPQN